MEKYIVVLITAANDDEASMLGKALVQEKLIACANLSPVNSIYRWKGELYEEAEVMLTCKAMEANLEKIIARVKELHSYEVPEIIALPILGGSKDYLDWVEENSSSESGK